MVEQCIQVVGFVAEWFVDLDWRLFGYRYQNGQLGIVQFGAAGRARLFYGRAVHRQHRADLQTAQFLDLIFVIDHDLYQAVPVTHVYERQAAEQPLFVQPAFDMNSFADVLFNFIA